MTFPPEFSLHSPLLTFLQLLHYNPPFKSLYPSLHSFTPHNTSSPFLFTHITINIQIPSIFLTIKICHSLTLSSLDILPYLTCGHLIPLLLFHYTWAPISLTNLSTLTFLINLRRSRAAENTWIILMINDVRKTPGKNDGRGKENEVEIT